MTKTTGIGVCATGALVLLVGAACVKFVSFDRPGLVGAGVGAGLGLLNLVVSAWLAMRSLKRGLQSAMLVLVGGFFARLLVLAGLVLWFQRVDAVSDVAFALVFMLFFFLYLLVEVLLVERTLQRTRRIA